ncbi:hypothetical protein PAMP_024121 [Pampus punctatissimus]
MVLALQYQGCSSRGLLCEERKGVIILRPPNHGGVTGFAFLASSYCVDMRSRLRASVDVRSMSGFGGVLDTDSSCRRQPALHRTGAVYWKPRSALLPPSVSTL